MINDKNNKDAVKDVFAEYRNVMNAKLTHPPISDAKFSDAHDAAFNEARTKFQGRRNRENEFPNDVFVEELEKVTTVLVIKKSFVVILIL